MPPIIKRRARQQDSKRLEWKGNCARKSRLNATRPVCNAPFSAKMLKPHKNCAYRRPALPFANQLFAALVQAVRSSYHSPHNIKGSSPPTFNRSSCQSHRCRFASCSVQPVDDCTQCLPSLRFITMRLRRLFIQPATPTRPSIQPA